MPSNVTSQNPHLNNIERAPYALGELLLQLPGSATELSRASDDVKQMAEAAVRHADNANYTVMSGLEAIGKMLFIAGANEDHTLDRVSLADLGSLIQHLAAEAQFYSHTAANLRFVLDGKMSDESKGEK